MLFNLISCECCYFHYQILDFNIHFSAPHGHLICSQKINSSLSNMLFQNKKISEPIELYNIKRFSFFLW